MTVMSFSAPESLGNEIKRRMIVSYNVYLSAAELAPIQWNLGFANGLHRKKFGVRYRTFYTVDHWQIPKCLCSNVKCSTDFHVYIH